MYVLFIALATASILLLSVLTISGTALETSPVNDISESVPPLLLLADNVIYTTSVNEGEVTYSDANNYAQIDSMVVSNESGLLKDLTTYSVTYNNETSGYGDISFYCPYIIAEIPFMSLTATITQAGAFTLTESSILDYE